MSEQEYYYNGQYVTIYGSVVEEEDLAIIKNDHGELSIAPRASLTKKENSYAYRRAQERAAELRAITDQAEKNLDALADKVVDKALKSLALRIQLNVAFGEGGSAAPYALMLSDQLKKMIKDEAPKVIKEKEDIFG